ncbi:MAG: hypothetical protein M5R36_07955 [Deltaproteobacteria bacterium]|nr:hypothetical protein [Deltaproteobacteria bacterium]
MAERLDVHEKEVIEMDARLRRPDLSFDMPLSDDTSTTVGDLTPSTGAMQDDALADKQMGEIYLDALEEFADKLKGKERTIYERRMLGDPPATLQELGDEFGVTRERVRQIEARILKKLRAYFDEKGIDAPE